MSDYLGVPGVHTHQPQRLDWRGCSKSAQLLSARLGPRACTKSRAQSARKVEGRGGGRTRLTKSGV